MSDVAGYGGEGPRRDTRRPPALKVVVSQPDAPPAEPTWLAMPLGVQLQLRPETGLIAASIQTRFAQDLYAFRQGHDVLGQYGFHGEDAGLLADPEIASGFAVLLDALIRAKFLVADWNLVDEAGAAIPIDATTLKWFFNEGPLPGTGSIMLAAFQQLTSERSLARLAAVGAADVQAEGVA